MPARSARPPSALLSLSALLLACAPIPPPPPAAPCVPDHPSPPVAAVTPPADAGPAAETPFDSAAWLDDFHTLLTELSSHYANLEWAANERHMDLPALKAKTETRLRDAKSADDAKLALGSFIEAFGDAHLSIDWNPETPAPDPASGPLCARLGYGKEQANPGVDFALAGTWTPIADADSPDFEGGVLRLRSGVKLGTIRIGLFMEQLHPAMCEAARTELALADDAKCDDDCQERLAEKVDERMSASLARRAVSLAHDGVAAVVVDITSNGGGSGWVEPAARVLTKVQLHAPRMGFVRHEHWAKSFREGIAHLEADRHDKGGPVDKDKKNDAVLASAEATLRASLDDTSAPCDRSALWEAGKPRPSCTQLVTDRFFTSGILPYAKAGSFDTWASRDTLFSSREYASHEGAVSLPLIVLVNSGTASASEEFAAMLSDNHAATLVGSLTTGCGCGFTNGGIPTTLPKSGAHVHAPDCARLRADGSNEASGIVPEVLVPFAWRDSPYQRATKAAVGLEAAAKKLGLRAAR